MNVYDDLRNQCLDEAADKAAKQLQECKTDLTFIKPPVQLGDYRRYLRALEQCIMNTQAINMTLDATHIKSKIEAAYKPLIDEYLKSKAAIDDKYENLVETTISSLEADAKEHNEKVKNEFNEGNRVYVELENKRKVLEQYADEIVDLCSEYGITTSDITIDNSSFTIDELSDIYDQYIDYLKKPKNHVNVIKEFRKKVSDPFVQAGVLIAIFILAMTPIRYVLAAAVVYVIINSQLQASSKVKYYSVLLGLLYNIKPLEMGFQDKMDETQLVEEEVDEDESEEVQSIVDDWEKEIEEFDNNEEDPQEQLAAELMHATSDYNDLMTDFKVLKDDFEQEKLEFLEELKERIVKAKAEFEEKKSQVKLLGDSVNTSAVFDTNFRLGLQDGVIEEYVDIGLSNIIVKPSANKDEQRDFLQVLFANALCNVRPTNLSVTVFDPNNSGQELVSFYSEDVAKYIDYISDKLDDVLKKLKEVAEKNLRDMRGMDINAFNKECEDTGKTPKNYHLLVVLSQPKRIEENEALREFMKYSAKFGVFVWVVTNDLLPGTKVFKYPFEGIQHPYPVKNFEFGAKVAKTLGDGIKNLKSPSLAWKDFVDIAIPDSKTWTGCADEFIELYPGFWEGDPTLYKPFTVGNVGDVHALVVGGSGAGKSVFMNHLICCIAKLFHPKEVELWLADFKGVEFSAYLANDAHPFMLPHIKACLCTSDPDYATSLFHALREMADSRYKQMMDVGVKNLPGWNQYWENKAVTEKNPDYLNKKWPRVLFICDEFQVIFEKAERNNLDSITADITQLSKVARAAGVHVMFGSQSMKKTVSGDILNQFTLRFALRCEPDVSQDILGTTRASDIKEKNGYLIVKSQEMTLDQQRRYRTPFLNDKPPKPGADGKPLEGDAKYSDLHRFIKSMYEKAIAEKVKFKDVITYEELTKHSINEIDNVYAGLEEAQKEGLIILGERMAYSANKAPDNVVMSSSNNTHIISVFNDASDIVNFYRTIKRNIELHGRSETVFVNSQVADFHYICELDKDVSPELISLSNEKVAPATLIQMFTQIYETKVATKNNDPAYYILIGWDKAPGFGVDPDTRILGDFANVLQLCGEYGMHFIFICSSIGKIPLGIVNACKYRMTGKCTEDESYKLLDSRIGAKIDDKMSNGYMYINTGAEIRRAKIYQSVIEREIKARELVI